MPRVIQTGQHPDLDPADFGLAEFECVPLGCTGEMNPYNHARRVEERMRAALRAPPELLIVQGDTSSAFGAAQAAFTLGIPVAHVEAGLRTHDPRLPWPEEEFRTAIDARAALLFAPTEVSATNLARERIIGAVHVTGNSGIDALLEVLAELPPKAARAGSTPRLLVTCHRRESWGAGLAEIAGALESLAGAVEIDIVLHSNPVVAEPLRQRLGAVAGIRLLEPLPHAALVERMRDSDLILSDSGGIQEEAPALGVPLLVLREKTERPEAIASGNALLLGTRANAITNAVRRLTKDPAALARMSRRAYPFGDGRASGRIASIIEDWLDQSTRRHG